MTDKAAEKQKIASIKGPQEKNQNKRFRSEVLSTSSSSESPEKMSSQEVGKLNINQWKEMLKELLDERLQPLQNKLEIVEELMHENIQIKSELAEHKTRILQLETEVEFLQIQARSKNLIFYNMDLKTNDNVQVQIQEFCSSILKLRDHIEIENTRILGKGKKSKSNVLVEFKSPQLVANILRQSSIINNTGISIGRDLPQNVKTKQNKLLAVRKELRRQKPELKIKVLNGLMFINNKKFTWCNQFGLRVDGEDGARFIKDNFFANVERKIQQLLQEQPARKREQGEQGTTE